MALDFPIKVSLFPGSSAVEQLTVNQLAGGSNPSRGAIPPSVQYPDLSLVRSADTVTKV